MILSFSKDDFKEKILNGTKKTTIRKGQRWSLRQKIHFWRGNPRNVRQNPHPFAESYVEHIQEVNVWTNGCINDGVLDIEVDGQLLNDEQKARLIKREGFDNVQDFKDFFPNGIKGQLITWACIKPI